MDMNDLAKSSFVGVNAQLQVFGRIGMARNAAINDMARNGFLDRPTTNKEMSDKKKSLFHEFPEDLQITAIMYSVQEYPATIQSKTNAMDIQSNAKQKKDNMVKRKRLEKATYKFIPCLIYRQMWNSDRRWKTSGEVNEEVIDLKLNNKKESGLKENIQMHYKGLG